MTAQSSILGYKLFLSLNSPDFSLFFYLKVDPPLEKGHLFSQQPPSKNRFCQAPLFENSVGGSTLSPILQTERKGVRTMLVEI